MDFVTLDFETATETRDSPCEIGLTFVKDGKVAETKSWLIKPASFPYFHWMNISIHGITPDDVKDSPEFPDIWNEVFPMIDGAIVFAHFASFDMSVMRQTLIHYGMGFPSLDYGCTCVFARKIFPNLPMYRLDYLCEVHNIPLDHHRAGADSRATAELALMMFEKYGITTVEDIPKKLNLNIGRITPTGHYPCGVGTFVPKHKGEGTRRERKAAGQIVLDMYSEPNPESIFYGKNVVFTGKLSSMARDDAWQVIANIGGTASEGINKNTEFLVVGQQDFRIVGQDGMSSKQRKAISMVEKGLPIEILSEEDFLKNL